MKSALLKKPLLVGLGVVAGALGAGGVALATIPSGTGVYTACVKSKGQVRLIDPTATQCKTTEKEVTWNQTGPAGAPGATGAKGATGPAGPQGAAGPTGPAELESTRFCTPSLCIDADPNSGGSGGWGWDYETNSAVTDLAVGQTAPFTVTVVQDGEESANGSITLTWNPTDFAGPTSGSDTSANCTTASTGNALSCTYSDLAHQDKSDSFNFKALADNPDAQVEVTAVVNGQQASAVFPVAITG